EWQHAHTYTHKRHSAKQMGLHMGTSKLTASTPPPTHTHTHTHTQTDTHTDTNTYSTPTIRETSGAPHRDFKAYCMSPPPHTHTHTHTHTNSHTHRHKHILNTNSQRET